ncbi:MAG TPA: M48 family metalloprotease [Xanthobacteraceae bacterium]|jgi:predicted Zn-dependent protease|nr:M48 family metalloprotease [Xanthobacteraceae bacterium]
MLAACTASPAPIAPQASVTTPAKQTDSGVPPAVQREHQRILATYGGVYNDPRLQAVIEKTVERLVAASERPDLHYKVTMLNSPSVNAFALPTGQLYVTRGLIALANDDSELASVLAHEMGHVIARHAEIREEQARQADLVSRVVTDVVSDPQAGALALAKSKLALASFSRSQEFEADAIGIGIAARAGYDPYGAVRFLSSMEHNSDLKQEQTGAINPAAPDFLSSHPATPERITNALANARQYRAPATDNGQDFVQAKAAYLSDIDGIVYGEDPSQGYVRGRRFLHPTLGFTFTAPDGFTLDNTAQAVLGIKRGGGQALRLDVVRVPTEQTLAEYLTSGWIENIDPATVEDVTINGFAGATAAAKGDQWDFRLYALRFGSDVYRFIFAAKHRTVDTDRAFRESVGTFRRMSLAEIEDAKPLRLQLVTVAPGDTVEKLAGKMVVSDHAVERFRALNGLDPGDRLKPGSQVKVVVE